MFKGIGNLASILEFELAREPNERNHNFRADLNAFGLYFGCGFKDRACLHFGNFGINDTETAASMTEHRIKFV